MYMFDKFVSTKLTTSNYKWFMCFFLSSYFSYRPHTSTIYVHLVTGKAPTTMDSVDQLTELKDPEIHLIKGTATLDIFRTSKLKAYKKV